MNTGLGEQGARRLSVGRPIDGRRNLSEIREIERVSWAQTFRPTFLRSPRSTDRLIPAVVWERDDQMRGPQRGAGDVSG